MSPSAAAELRRDDVADVASAPSAVSGGSVEAELSVDSGDGDGDDTGGSTAGEEGEFGRVRAKEARRQTKHWRRAK
jgi:hypothetical protein